ncbi:MAG: YggS family pyridoxal phosphate-dependent enzyme [Elusimicrobia bacterium]|nr:YggS family pyridoxal phosphate-dependent enzyme [Elusimicrobiota bacterium]
MDTARAGEIIRNFDAVQEKITKACVKSGRNPAEVEIVAVTKYASVKDIACLLTQGRVLHVGESRVQDALEKWSAPELEPFLPKVKKHLIGHIQTNKAGKAVAFFDSADSIDNIKTAQFLDRKAREIGKKIDAMVQLKLTQKETQGGVLVSQAGELTAQVRELNGLNLRGYMGIAPQGAGESELRAVFSKAKEIFDRDFPAKAGEKFYLSLGMTEDFEIAVEEGSNLPRIGGAIFNI